MATELCPHCNHPLSDHNDAGTFRGGQGAMCCYWNNSVEKTGKDRQFRDDGTPYACGCTYSGPGTKRYY